MVLRAMVCIHVTIYTSPFKIDPLPLFIDDDATFSMNSFFPALSTSTASLLLLSLSLSSSSSSSSSSIDLSFELPVFVH
jgi:hypothetical protein